MKKFLCAIMTMVLMMTSAFALADEINVISREDGSGTRGAFIELFGIEQKNEDGMKRSIAPPTNVTLPTPPPS